MQVYRTRTANTIAAAKVPNVAVFFDPAPAKVEGVADALPVEFAVAETAERVVWVAATRDVMPVAAAVAGAVPTTRAAEAVDEPVMVWKTT